MTSERKIECELCIVGAGIAGLNALSSAKGYLGGSDRVVVVDRRAAPGGMWNDTYDYVRLHQPHPFFTVGAIPWDIGKPRDHLATKPEVIGHLQRCAAEVFDGLCLTTLYESDYLSHDEVEVDGRAAAQVQVRDADGQLVHIRARTLIKAFGYDVWPSEPLRFSSEAVRSVSPHEPGMLDDEAPVYLLGSGKTAMDTATTILRRQPKRAVHMILGSGTVFLNRSAAFPSGARRFFGGTTGLRLVIDLSRTFDGTNPGEAHAHFRERYGLSLRPDAQHYAFGMISPEEVDLVREGLREARPGHVVDVRDEGGEPQLVFKDGDTQAVPEGSWVVNCTGYLDPPLDYEPLRSAGGAVLSVTPRSAIHLLTTYGGFLLPHLHYRGLFDQVPIYEADLLDLRRRDKVAWPNVIYMLALYNLVHIIGELPPSVLQTMGVNFDGWYPLPRRLWDFVEIKRNGRAHADRARRVLDRVRGHYDGLRCGPLPTTTA